MDSELIVFKLVEKSSKRNYEKKKKKKNMTNVFPALSTPKKRILAFLDESPGCKEIVKKSTHQECSRCRKTS